MGAILYVNVFISEKRESNNPSFARRGRNRSHKVVPTQLMPDEVWL